MLVLQSMINKQENSEFIKLQEVSIKMAIYGGNNASNLFNNYYIDALNNGATLKAQDHQKHQMAIVNAIRQEIGLNQLDYFELIAFRPTQS